MTFEALRSSHVDASNQTDFVDENLEVRVNDVVVVT
jgi:hypothetical protein